MRQLRPSAATLVCEKLSFAASLFNRAPSGMTTGRRAMKIRSLQCFCLAAVLVGLAGFGPFDPFASGGATDKEFTRIEQSIRNCIGWAGTKDFGLLRSSVANDADFLEVHPDGSVVKGFEEFRKAEKIWASPDFKAVRYEIRDLKIKLSKSRDVAWFFCILDDINEWKGQPASWENTRWTGVLEKRAGRWVMVQQHFSFSQNKANDRDTDSEEV
jgi:ketosteroid isomerase-like protein